MSKIMYFLGCFLILIGGYAIMEDSMLGGVLIILTGVLVFEPVTQTIKENWKPWNKLGVRLGITIGIFLVGGAFIDTSSISTKQSNQASSKSPKAQEAPHQAYLNKVKTMTAGLPEKDKEVRNKKLADLKANPLYKELIEDKKVEASYLPILTAIANSLSHMTPTTFAIDGSLMNDVKKMENGESKLEFVIAACMLSQPQKGGMPSELVDLFERYRKKYKYYGGSGLLHNPNTGKSETVEHNYDLSNAFVLFNPQNKKALDAVYEAKQKGYATWNTDVEDPIFPHLASSKGYNNYLKKVHSSSPYVINADYELSAIKLFKTYEANGVAADEKYKGKRIAVTGTIDDIGKDILDNPYVSLKVDMFQSVNCYFSNESIKAISNLRKGQKIKIIGTCDGMMLNLGVNLQNSKLL